MLTVPIQSKLIDDFKETFQKELRKSSQESYGEMFFVNRSRIRDIAIFLSDNGANFINLLIIDLGTKFELIYIYYFKFLKEKKYWFILTEVDKQAEIDSIEVVFAQAKYLEDELIKRYGLKFSPYTKEMEQVLFAVPTALNPPKKNLNLLPIGIYNKIHNDNHYFNTIIENEKILSVVEKTGWLYRGIIPLLQHKNIFKENLNIIKRICYPSSYHHSLAYIMAIEQLAGIEVQERVNLIRTLLCEFERYESHLIWFANLFYSLGFSRRYYYLINRHKELQKLYKKYFNNRFLDDLNFIGYTQDIEGQNLTVIQLITENLLPLVFNSVYYFSYKRYVKEKCQGLGILDKDFALDAGVTGPCLRATGINYDVRKENPYLSYLNKNISPNWDVVTFNEGDVFARIETRLWEMKNSSNLIYNLIDEIIDDESKIDPIDTSKIKLAANKIGLIQLESPQGELIYYIKTADRPGKTNLGGVFIATPSMKNFVALNNYILKNNYENDLSLIVHSMDLNFNEIDL